MVAVVVARLHTAQALETPRLRLRHKAIAAGLALLLAALMVEAEAVVLALLVAQVLARLEAQVVQVQPLVLLELLLLTQAVGVAQTIALPLLLVGQVEAVLVVLTLSVLLMELATLAVVVGVQIITARLHSHAVTAALAS